MAAADRTHQTSWLERARARFAALVAITLVAVSGGLLSELNRQAHAAPATPAVLLATG